MRSSVRMSNRQRSSGCNYLGPNNIINQKDDSHYIVYFITTHNYQLQHTTSERIQQKCESVLSTWFTVEHFYTDTTVVTELEYPAFHPKTSECNLFVSDELEVGNDIFMGT